MPIGIELIDHLSQVSMPHLLTLEQKEQTWTFDGYQQQPVLALLSGFSAPVKVNFTQNDAALQLIMTQAQDDFCRWDAGQKLLSVHIKNLLADPKFVIPESVFSAFEQIINSSDSAAFKAEQLTLPTFDELADAIEEVNPIALLDAIDALKLTLANKLAPHFAQQYNNSIQATYSNSAQAIGKRALKNICLSYLCLTPNNHGLLTEQYQQADNMTDSLAALQIAAKHNASCFNELKSNFETRWYDTVLVMDKWFAISASNNDQSIYQQLDNLMQHPLFSLTNPNRARALIGAFVANNPRHFHSACGRGYQFLAEQISLLNEINPQVASRLITPLIQFKGLDKARQAQIKVILTALHNLDNLSKDLKEKLDAALAG
jgi:aminopeptidase N